MGLISKLVIFKLFSIENRLKKKEFSPSCVLKSFFPKILRLPISTGIIILNKDGAVSAVIYEDSLYLKVFSLMRRD